MSKVSVFREKVVILHPLSIIGEPHSGDDDVITWLGRRPSEGCDKQKPYQPHNKKTMYLDSTKKTEIFGQYGKSATDTGSAESQIALFTFRIKHLTEHLKKNHKDYKTARSLTKLVGKRRALLNYLYDRDVNRYRAIIKALGLRK